MCINERLVYTAKDMPLKEGHTRTDAYEDNERGLGARFARKAFRSLRGIMIRRIQRNFEVWDFDYP